MFEGNYISNLSLENSSGGWNGMSAALHRELSGVFHLQYVGPINPPSAKLSRLVSKCWRTLGMPGKYYFFSQTRLRHIARLVHDQCHTQAAFDYFHGITPWVETSHVRPTFAFADACFATYYDTYHQRDKFFKPDLDRIGQQEKGWLERADTVFFTSHYAINECCRRYSMNGGNFEYVGMGASLESPSCDSYRGQRKLLFIAVNFERKGGDVCVASYKKFREQFGDASLTLIGAEPPRDVLDIPGVTWAGFLSKDNPEQLHSLQQHLSSSFALVLPTISDMTPVVLAEAGLFGCPTVAPRSFGIPEMIEDGRTGRLLSTPPQADQFAQALIEMANDQVGYQQMRQAVRARAVEQYTWKSVAERISNSILRKLNLVTM